MAIIQSAPRTFVVKYQAGTERLATTHTGYYTIHPSGVLEVTEETGAGEDPQTIYYGTAGWQRLIDPVDEKKKSGGGSGRGFVL